MESYFQFYHISEAFYIDEKELRLKYLQISKENHPDLFMNDESRYDEALNTTSINNTAFKQLKSFQNRLSHILRINDVLLDSNSGIPQEFLMEMMEVNESIMDLKMEPDAQKIESLIEDIDEMHSAFNNKLEVLAKEADVLEEGERHTLLEKIKDIYLKQKYVLRLKESLNTFAPL
ncbi:MAG: Fe-S protein assembly co-chaperone HscB [Bacteroidetes bacterium]|nr:MAG: Fe-S protein assembly co-chaperone HscB [Bacteroidota bacterium]